MQGCVSARMIAKPCVDLFTLLDNDALFSPFRCLSDDVIRTV